MTGEPYFTVSARMSSLPALLDHAHACCARAGLAANDGLRLRLVIEELFTNTVSHGHGGDCDAPVRVALRGLPGGIELRYEDRAPAFDPTAEASAARAWLDSTPGGMDERPLGHLGLPLVMGLATAARYTRAEGWNRLQLEFAREV